MAPIKSYGRICSFIFKALIGKWYRFHLLEELQGLCGNKRASAAGLGKELCYTRAH